MIKTKILIQFIVISVIEKYCPATIGYQMSILKKKGYINLKPLISSLLWNLHHENISFCSKVIPINVLENTSPGFKPSPSKIDKQYTL